MKKTLLTIAALFLGAGLFAQTLTGYDIMKKADNVPEPKTASSNATLMIHSKKGADRIRQVIMKRRKRRWIPYV